MDGMGTVCHTRIFCEIVWSPENIIQVLEWGPLSKNLTTLDSSGLLLLRFTIWGCVWFFCCIFVSENKLRKCGISSGCQQIYLSMIWGNRREVAPRVPFQKEFEDSERSRLFCMGREWHTQPYYVIYIILPIGSNHLLRMVMEPKYPSEEVIKHPNHYLTRWLDP